MKYLFISICFFLTLPVFAEECKRNITIELFDNQTQIDSEEFKYFSKRKENKKERKIYSFPILYIEGNYILSICKRSHHCHHSLLMNQALL